MRADRRPRNGEEDKRVDQRPQNGEADRRTERSYRNGEADRAEQRNRNAGRRRGDRKIVKNLAFFFPKTLEISDKKDYNREGEKGRGLSAFAPNPIKIFF